VTNSNVRTDGDQRRARVALSVVVTCALVTVAAASWLPAARGQTNDPCGHPPPTETPTPTPTETPPFTAAGASAEAAERFVTLGAEKGMVTTGGTVTMTGSLGTADGTCIPDVRIKIQGVTLGSGVPAKGGQAVTNAEGQFVAIVKVAASAEFTAVAPGETKEDPEATSTPVTVLSKVSMSARTRSLTPERGSKIEIAAQVRPPHPGSEAVLQRKTEKGWRNALRKRANDRGFTFKLKAKWKGKRVFRVTWIKSDEDHEPSSSNRLKIKTLKPRDRGDRNRGRGR
jgi:hypothetical protein